MAVDCSMHRCHQISHGHIHWNLVWTTSGGKSRPYQERPERLVDISSISWMSQSLHNSRLQPTEKYLNRCNCWWPSECGQCYKYWHCNWLTWSLETSPWKGQNKLKLLPSCKSLWKLTVKTYVCVLQSLSKAAILCMNKWTTEHWCLSVWTSHSSTSIVSRRWQYEQISKVATG